MKNERDRDHQTLIDAEELKALTDKHNFGWSLEKAVEIVENGRKYVSREEWLKAKYPPPDNTRTGELFSMTSD